MERIDTDDLLEVDKVERYVAMLELNQKYDRILKKESVSVVTENAQQRFVKSHPLLGEKMKLNAQIIALEKSINFVMDAVLPSPTETSKEQSEKNEREYEPGDLI